MSAANNRREVLKNFEMIEPEMVPILQAKTEAERLAMSWGMWRSARNMLLNMLNAEHPEWTEAEVQTEIAGEWGAWSSITSISTLETTNGECESDCILDQVVVSARAAREEHLMTNRLIHETSPYLRQHAHNPVDWFAWGPEALERARQLDRPIFLSIGYSACHWCHVMEKESFENPDVARLLNEHFVSIKVDREERPDLDQIYMTAVQV